MAKTENELFGNGVAPAFHVEPSVAKELIQDLQDRIELSGRLLEVTEMDPTHKDILLNQIAIMEALCYLIHCQTIRPGYKGKADAKPNS